MGAPDYSGAMAFADFLPVVMHAPAAPNKKNLFAELVVCILDSCTGVVESYMGPNYTSLPDIEMQERNLILLWYTPGHYQCLVRDDATGSKIWMTYMEFKQLLAERGVEYIET